MGEIKVSPDYNWFRSTVPLKKVCMAVTSESNFLAVGFLGVERCLNHSGKKQNFFRCMSFRYHLIHHPAQPFSPLPQISPLPFTEHSTAFEVCGAPALSAEQWKCRSCHCTSRAESVTCLAWEWCLVWLWAQVTSSWFSSLIWVAARAEHRDVAGSRGESSVTSFNSKSVAVGPLKRNCVPKPKEQHLNVPSVLSSEWCVAFSKKLPLWKGCRIFRLGFLIHFCHFVSSVNKTTHCCWLCIFCCPAAFCFWPAPDLPGLFVLLPPGSASATPGGNISVERCVGALRCCFVGCIMINKRSCRLWLRWKLLLLPWGLCEAAGRCLQLLLTAQDFINV